MAIIVLSSPPLPICSHVSHHCRMCVTGNLASFCLNVCKAGIASPFHWTSCHCVSLYSAPLNGLCGVEGKTEKELPWLLVTCFSSIPGFARPSGWRVLRAICTFHHSVVSPFANMPCPQCKRYMPLTWPLRETYGSPCFLLETGGTLGPWADGVVKLKKLFKLCKRYLHNGS